MLLLLHCEAIFVEFVSCVVQFRGTMRVKFVAVSVASALLLAGCQTGQKLDTPAAALTSATKTTAKLSLYLPRAAG